MTFIDFHNDRQVLEKKHFSIFEAQTFHHVVGENSLCIEMQSRLYKVQNDV